jgi:phosphomannomutase
MTLIKSISGIRGTIGDKPGEGLTPHDILKFSIAYASWIKETNRNRKVVIGRDARISGMMVRDIVVGALSGMGIEVIDLGLSTTPTVEYAVPIEKAGGGIIITASHNPKQWNALKLLNEKGEFISEAEGKRILELAEQEQSEFADINQLGKVSFDQSYIEKHIKAILELPFVDVQAIASKNYRVVIDCVNSTGGIALPILLRALGVKDIVELYCVPDGKFPHNPEPLPEHLNHLSTEVQMQKAHLGIAVDPDVDRLCFVNEDGSMFGEEYTLVAIADYILKTADKAWLKQHDYTLNTVSNLSSTISLKEITEKNGGSYQAAAVGEVNVVNKMKATKAVIGGEGNGGIILPCLHYGRDALVGIAIFLTHLAKSNKTISVLRNTYPNYKMTKSKIELEQGIDVDKIIEALKHKYKDQEQNHEDGLKIIFDKEWVHLRKSNTEPIIRIYAEGVTDTTSGQLVNKIIADVKEIIS